MSISADVLREHVCAVKDKVQRSKENLKRGIITEEEYRNRVKDALWYEGVFTFLQEHGLRISMIKEETGSIEDRNMILQLHEELGLPLDLYEDIDFRGPSPIRHNVHTYNNCQQWVADYDCVEDGGLMADPSPEGKTFRLKDRLGLTAELTIKEVMYPRQVKSGAADRSMAKCFAAEGWIEGYTVIGPRRLPEVNISAADGHICSLGYYETFEDYEAYSAFPLWQPYLQACDIHRKKNDEIWEGIFEKL